ncbi:MAG: tyrosine--tRNA ligase [Patescibacteria group bacterium]
MTNLLTRRVANVLPTKKQLEERLAKGSVKIYLGIDPSSPFLHIGHAVVLWKLKEFQDAGHKVILLVGDFTGMIGDPTDRSAARVKLTKEQVLENAQSYKEQIGKIIRFEGENPAELKFNSEWLSPLTFSDVIELSSNLTVQQLLERDFFQKRLKEQKPIHLHEFLYPLIQGYDSVYMSVDIEIGGTDQTFNMLIGRTLMRSLRQKDKFVITVPLLEGLDGRKMSKSFNNFIAITDNPTVMFGKIMSLKDDLIPRYFDLATTHNEQELANVIESIKTGELHPMEAKKKLAWEIVKLYHSQNEAEKAKEEFEEVFQKGETPKNIETVNVKSETVNVIDVLTNTGTLKSRSEARRLLEQGGLEWNGEKIDKTEIAVNSGGTLRVGKHRFLRIESSAK